MTQIAHPARRLRGCPRRGRAGALRPVIGRVLMAAIDLMSGIGEAGASGGTLASIEAAGLPLPQAAFAVAVLVEIGGGLLQVAGFGAGAFSFDARRGRA